MRDGETEFEAEIGRRLGRTEGGERLLHGAQGGKFARAGGAGFQMMSDLLHLVSADGAIDVGRKKGLALLTDLTGHRFTNSLDASAEGYDAAFCERAPPSDPGPARD